MELELDRAGGHGLVNPQSPADRTLYGTFRNISFIDLFERVKESEREHERGEGPGGSRSPRSREPTRTQGSIAGPGP